MKLHQIADKFVKIQIAEIKTNAAGTLVTLIIGMTDWQLIGP